MFAISSVDMVNLINVGLLAVLIVTAIAALISTAYISWVYAQRREDAVYLALLVKRDRRVAVGGVLILGLSTYSLVRVAFPDLMLVAIPPPGPGVLITIAIELMLWGVINDALQMHRDRRPPRR